MMKNELNLIALGSIARTNKQEILPQEAACIQGFESILNKRAKDEKRQNMLKCTLTVLLVQKRQKKLHYEDPQTLSEMYSDANKQCQLNAYKRGLKDAPVATASCFDNNDEHFVSC
jgi:hypothetical protein